MGLITLSDHVHDIVENSIKAGATNIKLIINETRDKFEFCVEDNGPGIPEEILTRIFDPFYTTRSKKIRKVGLGLPFLKQATEMTGGFVNLTSKKGVGTTIKALFFKSHIDCQPVGNLVDTIFALLLNQEINWYIKRCFENDCYEIDSSTIEKHLGKINTPSKMKLLGDFLKELEKMLKDGEDNI
ncbi:ATP-binding protein [Thermosipho ferrireducens]|uniref:histidine kinase n=1 Tax=Thermosipho ferrireducens TaxID=2571116 RepID=A0ABX7SAU9_9BACT|nr:ATP-binding protein [Thermosipho ferrireducens]QTA38583.1 ATP-binding protein [Thermosipho ferrireducens]